MVDLQDTYQASRNDTPGMFDGVFDGPPYVIELPRSQFPLSPTQLKSSATLPEREISTNTGLLAISIEIEVFSQIL